MSTSMYGIFNWGQTNNSRIETRPKRFSLALAGSEINIDDPPAGDSKFMYKKGEETFLTQKLICFFMFSNKQKKFTLNQSVQSLECVLQCSSRFLF